ncbi:hypothetical protein B0T16DRAFT_407476 [Cercophora newfieldiana]|uniref:Uncharacterized protein n=1 Tax=Cercophora newfieldiana TaxID=92897 RepID=A0AA40CXR3_9PEZI|nr:hypothetical protein B0T16DRAFT_407476 [Cercophora newfieldiana]
MASSVQQGGRSQGAEQEGPADGERMGTGRCGGDRGVECVGDGVGEFGWGAC